MGATKIQPKGPHRNSQIYLTGPYSVFIFNEHKYGAATLVRAPLDVRQCIWHSWLLVYIDYTIERCLVHPESPPAHSQNKNLSESTKGSPTYCHCCGFSLCSLSYLLFCFLSSPSLSTLYLAFLLPIQSFHPDISICLESSYPCISYPFDLQNCVGPKSLKYVSNQMLFPPPVTP